MKAQDEVLGNESNDSSPGGTAHLDAFRHHDTKVSSLQDSGSLSPYPGLCPGLSRVVPPGLSRMSIAHGRFIRLHPVCQAFTFVRLCSFVASLLLLQLLLQ